MRNSPYTQCKHNACRWLKEGHCQIGKLDLLPIFCPDISSYVEWSKSLSADETAKKRKPHYKTCNYCAGKVDIYNNSTIEVRDIFVQKRGHGESYEKAMAYNVVYHNKCWWKLVDDREKDRYNERIKKLESEVKK